MFVFGVLVEYTIVLYLDNLVQRKRKRKEIRKKLEREEKAKVSILNIHTETDNLTTATFLIKQTTNLVPNISQSAY